MIHMTVWVTNCKRRMMISIMIPLVAAGLPTNPLAKTSTFTEVLPRSPMRSTKKLYDSIVKNRLQRLQSLPQAPPSIRQRLSRQDTRHTRVRDISQTCKSMLVCGAQARPESRKTLEHSKAAVRQGRPSNGVPAVYLPRR